MMSIFLKHVAASLRLLLGQRLTLVVCASLKVHVLLIQRFLSKHIVIAMEKNVSGIFQLAMSNADECRSICCQA